MAEDRPPVEQQLRYLVQLAVDIMAMLAAHPGMLGHFLDSDENEGERLRRGAAALGVVPSGAMRRRIEWLADYDAARARDVAERSRA